MGGTLPPANYVLGHAAEELDRLARQARLIEPITRRIFLDAGLRAGMRVLDVGCGAGDVSFLVADIVGNSGSVVGCDRSDDAIRAATARAQQASMRNVTFRKGELDEIPIDEPFDAVVGRYVLAFQRDAASTLRQITRQMPSGAVVAFHETDWAFARSTPPVETFDRCCRWLVETLRGSGVDPHLGLRLPAIFEAAGLPIPRMRIECVAASGTDSLEEIRFITDLARTLLPSMERLGIADPESIGIDRLHERIHVEMAGAASVLVGRSECGAWARTP